MTSFPNGSRLYGMATDSAGNLVVTGFFTQQLTFGNTTLVCSMGQVNMFLAKWSSATGTWVWAVQSPRFDFAMGTAVAIRGNTIYVVGNFSSPSGMVIANTTVSGPGTRNVFLAKYTDNGSSVTGVWATSMGGSAIDEGRSVAVNGSSVYVSGVFGSGSGAVIGGTSLAGAGNEDGFVAKFVDAGRTVTAVWGQALGGPGVDDVGEMIAVNNAIYVTGTFNATATIGGTSLVSAGAADLFVAKLTDAGSSATSNWAVRGGGAGSDIGYALAVAGNNVYVGGKVVGGNGTMVAGMSVPSAGYDDILVAKYVDLGNSAANGWAYSGGGADSDQCYGLAVVGNSVYVGGGYSNTSSAMIAGIALPPVVGSNAVLVKLTDVGSTAVGNWAQYGGGPGTNYITAITVHRNTLAVGGTLAPTATFGPFVAPSTPTMETIFVAQLTDLSLPTAINPAAKTTICLTLSPNPTTRAITATGLSPRAPVEVFDALGRSIGTTATADATGTARLTLPAGLPAGVYLVRSGGQVQRLAVE